MFFIRDFKYVNIITYIYFTNNRHYVFFHERDCKRNFK